MSIKSDLLLLPGDPGFYETLSRPPELNRDDRQLFVVKPGSLLMEPVNDSEMIEYLYSGEYDERLSEIDGNDSEDEIDF